MDWLIIKTFLALALIVGLMFGVLFIMRKYIHAKPHFVNENLRILTSLAIAQKDPFGQPKKAIYVVKVFNKVLMVGVSDNSIASLGEITDSDVIQKLESAVDSTHKISSSFAGQVKRSFAEILSGRIPSGKGM